MSGLEGVVRPFQTPVSLATTRIVASNTKLDVGAAILAWGKAGTIAAAHQIDRIDPTGADFTVIKCNDEFTEVGRKVDQLHIVQTLPDGTKNPDNYVDLDRPYQVVMKKASETDPAKNTTQTFSYAFDSRTDANLKPVAAGQQNCQSQYNFNRNP